MTKTRLRRDAPFQSRLYQNPENTLGIFQGYPAWSAMTLGMNEAGTNLQVKTALSNALLIACRNFFIRAPSLLPPSFSTLSSVLSFDILPTRSGAVLYNARRNSNQVRYVEDVKAERNNASSCCRLAFLRSRRHGADLCDDEEEGFPVCNKGQEKIGMNK